MERLLARRDQTIAPRRGGPACRVAELEGETPCRATSGCSVCTGGKGIERRCVGRRAGRCRAKRPGEGPCQAKKLARAAPNKS
eukprot:1113903-Prymnesium_polylepis.1